MMVAFIAYCCTEGLYMGTGSCTGAVWLHGPAHWCCILMGNVAWSLPTGFTCLFVQPFIVNAIESNSDQLNINTIIK